MQQQMQQQMQGMPMQNFEQSFPGGSPPRFSKYVEEEKAYESGGIPMQQNIQEEYNPPVGRAEVINPYDE